MGSLYEVNSSTGDVTTAGTFVSNTTTSGLLFPRLTTVERDAIVSPSAGMQIYNTDTNVDEFYNGTMWGPISSGGGGTPGGNSGDIQFNSSGTFGGSDNITARVDVGATAITITGTGSGEVDFTMSHDGNKAINFTNLDTSVTHATIYANATDLHVQANQGDLLFLALSQPFSFTHFGSFVLPQISTSGKNSIPSPAEGTVVYDVTLHKLSVFTGSVWETVTSA